jgi:hypothetical protein
MCGLSHAPRRCIALLIFLLSSLVSLGHAAETFSPARGSVYFSPNGGATDALAVSPSQQDVRFCGSQVPRIVSGTTKPEAQNGSIASNDAAVCGSQILPKGAKSRAPQNGPGNHHPGPIGVGDWVWLFAAEWRMVRRRRRPPSRLGRRSGQRLERG